MGILIVQASLREGFLLFAVERIWTCPWAWSRSPEGGEAGAPRCECLDENEEEKVRDLSPLVTKTLKGLGGQHGFHSQRWDVRVFPEGTVSDALELGAPLWGQAPERGLWARSRARAAWPSVPLQSQRNQTGNMLCWLRSFAPRPSLPFYTLLTPDRSSGVDCVS